MKKAISLLVSMALALVFALGMIPKEALADTPDVYKVYFDTAKDRWTYKVNDKDTGHWEFYYMYQSFKDGDKLVIDGYGATKGVTVELNDKRISELAFCSQQTAIVYAKYVDYVYTTTSATGIVNGDVGTAKAVDDSTLQINGNANTVTLKKDDGSGAHANVHVQGTVAYAEVAQRATGLAAMPAYNFAADSFSTENREIYLQTDTSKYSTTGTAPAATTPSTETAADASAATSGKTLDSVPKTGFTFDFSYVLIGLGLICLIGAAFTGKRMGRVNK